jgi:uncharacterized damage-inducible protein DinB
VKDDNGSQGTVSSLQQNSLSSRPRRPSRYSSHGKEFAETYDQILLLMEDLHKQSMEIFARLTDEDLQKKCPTPGGVQITTWKWLRSLAEHEIRRRGQLYPYLAFLGVPTPPLYGLSSQQVRSS